MTRRLFTPAAADFPASADVVVAGGGIVGAATAFFAGRAGLSVLVVERRGALATLNTTRSLEAFRAQFEDPAEIAMMRESIGMFERFGELIGAPGYDISIHQQGYLFLSQRPDGPERVAARVAAQHAAGLEDVELLSGDECRRRFPWLAEDVTAAAFRARDGWLASHEVTYGFAGASGARFFVDTAVTGVETRGGRVTRVLTDRGGIDTRALVIACGPFSGLLAHACGASLPIAPVRRHRAGIRAHPLIPRQAPMTVSLETGAHWRPEAPGAYLGWSGAIDEPEGEPKDDVAADWSFPALAIDACARFSPFWDEVARSLSHGNVTVQAGQYDLTPDARPLIGPVEGISGLFAHTGYSGHGVMGSPAGARLLVDVMCGRVPPAANPFRPSRFVEGAVQGKLPL
jgi:sarcosine oxidase subunit beta